MQDENGTVRASFSNLLAISDRQGALTRVALHVTEFRLESMFSVALEEE